MIGVGSVDYDDSMNATPLLSSLLAALAEAKLEAVLIGNAAAAMHGAPVTTIDFDFMFRDTPTNLRKLKVATRKKGVRNLFHHNLDFTCSLVAKKVPDTFFTPPEWKKQAILAAIGSGWCLRHSCFGRAS